MAGILQAKKAGYPLDMEGFWLGDKFRIIADLPLAIMRPDNSRFLKINNNFVD